MFQDACEFQVIEHTVLVNRCFTKHFINIFVSEAVTHAGEKLAKPFLVYAADVLFVEAGESVLDDILRVGALQPLPEEGQEHREINRARSFVHHAVQVRVRWVLAERGQHIVQVLLVDETIPVLVNHVKRFLELLYLRLVEHSEHIRCGSLGPFLRGAPAFGLPTRHGSSEPRASDEVIFQMSF
uniref:Uncharacterized protein n=1 Tax=Rhipicephalus zambeziensis TaxID=60191 RepID=A0A224YJ57_9ACAR